MYYDEVLNIIGSKEEIPYDADIIDLIESKSNSVIKLDNKFK